VGSYT